jgi:hypothetical protein
MNLLGVDDLNKFLYANCISENWIGLANFEAVGRALGMANGFLDFAWLRIKVFVSPMPKYFYAL